MPDIAHLITINAPIQRVYDALTSIEGVRNWWTRDAEFQAHVGGEVRLRFHGGIRTLAEVVEFNSPRRSVWRVTQSNAPGGWAGTTIVFELAEKDAATEVSMQHLGFRELDKGVAVVTTGWAYYLASLQRYLERGSGRPHQEKDVGILTSAVAERGVLRGLGKLQIAHEIRVRSTPRAVYEALTEPARLAQWWIPDTRGTSRVGANLEFWFSREGCQTMRVSELRLDTLVRWRVPEGDTSDWAGTEVEFNIVEGNPQTTVSFRHYGWQAEIDRFPYYSMSWAVFLVSLKDLLQKGRGYPFPNEWIHD